MATKRIRRKAEGRNIIVNVKVGGDAKPKRKRRAPRRKTTGGASGISPIGRTEVTYTPPLYTPSPAQVLPQVAPLQAIQPNVSGLLEDVKRERTNLLKDIERQTEQQIVQYVGKQQGAEQRSELARMDAFDPFSTKQYAQPSQRLGDVATSKQPPSLTAMMKPDRPKIEEIDEDVLPFAQTAFLPVEDRPRPTGKPKKLKIVEKPQKKEQPPEQINKNPPEANIAETKPEETVREVVGRTQGLRRDPYFKTRDFYERELRPLGLPRVRDDIPQWKEQIVELYDIAKRAGKVKRGGVSKNAIEQYYGSELFRNRTSIPTRVMEEEPFSQATAEKYNLV